MQITGPHFLDGHRHPWLHRSGHDLDECHSHVLTAINTTFPIVSAGCGSPTGTSSQGRRITDLGAPAVRGQGRDVRLRVAVRNEERPDAQ